MTLTGKTLEELYDPAMLVTDPARSGVPVATEYLVALVARHRELWPDDGPEESEANVKSNLGYWAGYYSHETRERVEGLFGCEHPYFGSIAKNGPPTSEQAFMMGIALGKAHSEEKLRKTTAKPTKPAPATESGQESS